MILLEYYNYVQHYDLHLMAGLDVKLQRRGYDGAYIYYALALNAKPDYGLHVLVHYVYDDGDGQNNFHDHGDGDLDALVELALVLIYALYGHGGDAQNIFHDRDDGHDGGVLPERGVGQLPIQP
jgi:hypothetical protein